MAEPAQAYGPIEVWQHRDVARCDVEINGRYWTILVCNDCGSWGEGSNCDGLARAFEIAGGSLIIHECKPPPDLVVAPDG